jgi:hypothetical protein
MIKLVENATTSIMEQEVTVSMPVKNLAMFFAIVAKHSTADVREMVRETGFNELADNIANCGKDDLPYEAYKQLKAVLLQLGVDAE